MPKTTLSHNSIWEWKTKGPQIYFFVYPALSFLLTLCTFLLLTALFWRESKKNVTYSDTMFYILDKHYQRYFLTHTFPT